VYRLDVDDLHLVELLGEFELYLRIAAAGLDVALGAVGVQIGADTRAQVGTSIGRIDERQLFYLESRGIAEEEGKRLLLAEFFRDVAEGLAPEDQKKFFQYAEERI